MLLATLDGLQHGTIQARPQPVEGVSYAGKVTVADARVDWSAPAVGLDRLIRSVTEPGGHAAWTGLACAALFTIGRSRSRWFGWLRFLVVFAGVVWLHSSWDSLADNRGYLIVGTSSFILLMAATWWLHRDRRRAVKVPA